MPVDSAEYPAEIEALRTERENLRRVMLWILQNTALGNQNRAIKLLTIHCQALHALLDHSAATTQDVRDILVRLEAGLFALLQTLPEPLEIPDDEDDL